MRDVVVMKIPHLHPYKCAGCGADHTSGRKFFVDMGIDQEWEGVLYFCNCCFDNTSKAVGYFSQENVNDLLAIQQEQLKMLSEFQQKIKVYEDTWEKVSGSDLQTFFKNLETMNANRQRSNSELVGVTEAAKRDHPSASKPIERARFT